MREQGLGSVDDEAQVRFPKFVEGRGQAQNQGVRFSRPRQVRGRLHTAGQRRGDPGAGDVLDMAGAGRQLGRVAVEADGSEARLGEPQQQRKAHVAKTDHADNRLFSI